MPFQVAGVAVAFLSIEPGEAFLEVELNEAPGAILGAPALVYLKLKSPRMKDRADVIELIKSGLDVSACRAYLASNAAPLVAELDDAVIRAASEEE